MKLIRLTDCNRGKRGFKNEVPKFLNHPKCRLTGEGAAVPHKDAAPRKDASPGLAPGPVLRCRVQGSLGGRKRHRH